MITKSDILREINNLSKLHAKARKQGLSDEENYFGKLLLLEVCGWIEQSMDEIILSLSQRKISKPSNKKHLEYIVIMNNSFEYKKNFLRMIANAVGLIIMEDLERKFSKRIGLAFQNVISDEKNNKLKEICMPMGQHTVDKIIAQVDKQITTRGLGKFISDLATLKEARNTYAHTHISGTTTKIFAPSWIKPRFESVYLGLKAFEKQIKIQI